MEMSKTTIDQLSRRNKDETQNSTASRVKNKYLEAQVQTEIFFNENCITTEIRENAKQICFT